MIREFIRAFFETLLAPYRRRVLTPRQRHADFIIRKMYAEQKKLDALRARWRAVDGACCPECWSGGRTSKIIDAQERRATMLAVQLKRDPLPQHLEFLRLAREGNLDLAEPLSRFTGDPCS